MEKPPQQKKGTKRLIRIQKMSNQYTPSKIKAMAQGKCPRCQSGKLFCHNAIGTHFMDMHTHCPVCDLQFEIEPGFFWGAMYVSYAITCAILLILGGAVLVIGNNPDFWIYMAIILPSFVLASPFTYRYSRILMLYWFAPVHFEERFARKS
ncbi:MAG: DUF983 domain-containing protein [Bacteroidia bacterium]